METELRKLPRRKLLGGAAASAFLFACGESSQSTESKPSVADSTKVPTATVKPETSQTASLNPTQFEILDGSNEDRILTENSMVMARDYFYGKMKVYAENKNGKPIYILFKDNGPKEPTARVSFSTRSILINTNPEAGWVKANDNDKRKISVHEYFHFIQADSSVNGIADIPDYEWFYEGAAEYSAIKAVSELGFGNFEQSILEAAERVKRNGIGNLTSSNSPEFKENPGFYSLLFLATYKLVGNKGFGAISEYYQDVARGVRRETAFINAFKRTEKDFLKEFEDYRKSL